MERAPNLQRMWKLTKPRVNCIGALCEGPVPGVTPPGMIAGFSAVISFAEADVPESGEAPDGRLYSPSQWTPDITQLKGTTFPTLHDALISLEEKKRELLADGWVEVSLDPVADPD